MSNVRAFHPTLKATKNIAATTTSANVLLIANGTSVGQIQVEVYNSGAVPVFICQGADNTVAASLTLDKPVAPGAMEVLSFGIPAANPSATGLWIAAITASGTATVYFTPGQGV